MREFQITVCARRRSCKRAFGQGFDSPEVDCKKSAVPEALIPVPVKEYVKANFPREIITKIERGRTGVEIELGNDYSLKFNKKGKFVSMDD